MGPATKKLIEISGARLSSQSPIAPLNELGQKFGVLARHIFDLSEMLCEKNGFVCFEASLRFFPSHNAQEMHGIVAWNSGELWKCDYVGHADAVLFFAEDVFGGQFGIKAGKIVHFDPETAELEILADSIEEFCSIILLDYSSLTGYQLSRDWQRSNRSLQASEVLFPKLPFILGGEYKISNLIAMEAVRAMKNYGNLASQLHDLPNGSKISWAVQ